MHEVGEKVVGALREQFPDYDVSGREQDFGNWLGVKFAVDGKRYVAYTPENTDYRRIGYQVWLHRFTELIRLKESPP